MQDKLFISILIISIVLNLSSAYSVTGRENAEIMKKFCSVRSVKEGINHVCPICPEFNEFAGEDYDKFTVTEVISGNFIPGKDVKYIGYFGCEPRKGIMGGEMPPKMRLWFLHILTL